MNMRVLPFVATAIHLHLMSSAALAAGGVVSNAVIEKQRQTLANATRDVGFGPQSPRDIDATAGENTRHFQPAPQYTRMNLCNIHFHEGAEHKGGEFTKFAGNGDGKGYGSGYLFSGTLTDKELAPVDIKVGSEKHGTLVPGDTIEVHYVFTTAKIKPGPTLGSCLSDAIKNPQLRVEAQVFVLVNDDKALDFGELTRIDTVDDLHQAINIPKTTGTPIRYAGSTTGPSYNEKGSPLQVSWSVRPKVAKVNIRSLAKWLEGNVFKEDHAHGVRNLVKNKKLLSGITQ